MARVSNCISAVAPAVKATNAMDIREVYRPSHVDVKRTSRFLSARAIVAIFAAGGVVIAGVSSFLNVEVVVGLVIYVCLSLPLLFAGAYSYREQTRHVQERTICLADGVVTFATASEAEASLLRACCWFYGKATDDPHLFRQKIRQKAILLVFPSGRTIACGLTQPLYSQWLDAIRVNHCRQVLRLEGALGCLVFALTIVGFGCGASLGETMGTALQDALFQQPQNNQLGNLLPALFFILGAWFGAVTPWFIPRVRRYTEHERQQLIRFAVLLPAKFAVPAGAVLGGNLVAGLALALFFTGLLLVLTRLVCRVPQPVLASRHIER